MAFTVKEFLARVPRSDLHDGDVYYTEPPRGRRQPPPRRQGDPSGLRRRAASAPSRSASPTGPTSAAPSPAPTCRGPATPTRRGSGSPRSRSSTAGGPTRAFDVVMANVRGREEREGDCRAQFAAVDVAARRLGELFRRYGVADDHRLLRAPAEGERAPDARRPEDDPPGVYTGEDWVDDDGHDDVRVPIRVAVTVRGDRATFDFAGTGATVKGPINTTPFVAASAVYYSVKSLVGPDVPANDGAYRPIAVEVPPDTILNPPPGAPVVGGNHETSQRVVDACYKALAAALPERITAGGPTTSGLLLFGTRPGRPLAHPLRGPRRRRGGRRPAGRRPRRARPHVQRDEHADRGHRDRVPDGDPPPRAPAGERRRRATARRLRAQPRLPGARRVHADDDARAAHRAALGRVRRRRRVALPGHARARRDAPGRQGQGDAGAPAGGRRADRDVRGRRLRGRRPSGRPS